HQARRPPHEAVTALERDQRLGIAPRGSDRVERSARAGRIEEDLADEDEVVAAAPRGGGEALGKARERFGGDALDGGEPVFLEAGELTREGMKIPVAREKAPGRARRQRGEGPAEEGGGGGRGSGGWGDREGGEGRRRRAARAG